jgi:hypothetical protein
VLTIVGQQQAAKHSCNASRMFEALSLSKQLRGSSRQALVSLQKRQKGDLLCVFRIWFRLSRPRARDQMRGSAVTKGANAIGAEGGR